MIICGVGELGKDGNGTCQAFHRASFFMHPDEFCTAEPEIEIITGCVHEHVRRFVICGGCSALMTEQGNEWWCGYCYNSSDPHGCTMEIVSERWLEESASSLP